MPPTFLHSFARVDEDDFITIVSGKGAAVYDDAGRRYVDALASLWYCNVGHGRSDVVDAITKQMRQLEAFHTFDRFTNPPADAICAVLAELAPMADVRVFLTSGGSEAVDTALKLSRFAHGVAGDAERTHILSRAPSYHGVTYGGLSATGLPDNQAHFGPLLPQVHCLPHQDITAMEAAFAEHGPRVAAVITEPVTGGGGVHPPPPGYLQRLRELCDEHGAFLIIDEVICGFGRLGSWWGAQHYGVRPDLVTFAKGVTSGYQPLGGVLVGPAVLARLEAVPGTWFRHGYTYSGHPASCVAALTVAEIIRREGLLQRATTVGAQLAAGLRELAKEDVILEARGDGAVWAVELHEGVNARAVRDVMLEHGVIARPLGDSTIAFCPPLVIENEDLERCHHALEEAVRAVRRRPS